MIKKYDTALSKVKNILVSNPHLWKNKYIRDEKFLTVVAENIIETLGYKKQ